MQITMLEAIMGTNVQLSNRLWQRMNPIYIASILIKPISPVVNCFANWLNKHLILWYKLRILDGDKPRPK